MLYPEIEQFLAELPIAPPSIDRKEKWDALANKLIKSNKKGAIILSVRIIHVEVF